LTFKRPKAITRNAYADRPLLSKSGHAVLAAVLLLAPSKQTDQVSQSGRPNFSTADELVRFCHGVSA
jgi:hypothetical protein